ncbi:MAG: hypothetical protein JNM70_03105 [Anaerolineae bacterium]|nr:hypothetical protein [Anaerolineae bacterium]
MSLGRRPVPQRGRGGPPAWIVFLAGVAVIFGVYYVWLGVQNFLRTGGRGVVEATQQAEIGATATAQFVPPTDPVPIRATATPIPECQQFVVIVANARVRESPSENGAVITAYFENDPVCVLGRAAPGSEWYVIDSRPQTRRLELAYMHESVIAAVNPTVTPTRTPTLTRTLTPTRTPTITRTPRLEPTIPSTSAPNPTPLVATPPPTVTPVPTVPMQNA